MRLATLFRGLLYGALALGLVAVAGLAAGAREADRVIDGEQRAQRALVELSGLLALSQEVMLYGQERSVRQWRSRWSTLTQVLQPGPDGGAPIAPALAADAFKDAPALFEELVQARRDDVAPLREPRRELLIDGLSSQLQELNDQVFTWAQGLAEQRRRLERRVALFAVGLPALLTLLFAGALWWVARRVLRPVARLQRAMDAVAAGRLDTRLETTARDELADLKRQFNHMASELEARTGEVAQREAFLRGITDALPLRIAYFDLAQKLRFANALTSQRFGRPLSELLGRDARELYRPEVFALVRPHIDAALRGEPNVLQRRHTDEAGARDFESHYLPDRGPDGVVRGYFALGIDVTERVQSQLRIEAALSEKDALLRELHHRVKNNMQVVASLLRLQGRAVDHAAAREALAECGQRIRAMSLVHELLYRSSDLARIALDAYVKELVDALAAALGARTHRVTLDLAVQPLPVDAERAVPLGLILNELVTNSFKHGVVEGRAGTIRIVGERDAQGRMMLSVADDGPGLPPGFDPAQATSLGLRLVATLAGQLAATLDYGSGPGLSCRLTLPAAGR